MNYDRTPRRVDLAEIAGQHFPERDPRDPAVLLLGAFMEIAGALTLDQLTRPRRLLQRLVRQKGVRPMPLVRTTKSSDHFFSAASRTKSQSWGDGTFGDRYSPVGALTTSTGNRLPVAGSK